MKHSILIPLALEDKVKALSLSTKSEAMLYKLVASCLHELEESNHSTTSFYKPMGKKYIQRLTSDHFYKKHFQAISFNFNQKRSSITMSEAIFQTDGSYKVSEFPMRYRINPELLTGSAKRVQIEIPDVNSLNELFPELIGHYNFSLNQLQVEEELFISNLSEELMIGWVKYADNPDIVLIGRNNREMSTLSKITSLNKHVSSLSIFGEIEKREVSIHNLSSTLQRARNRRKDEEFVKIIIDGEKVSIDNVMNYIEQREKRAQINAKFKIQKLLEGETYGRISSSNGRLNTSITSLPNFTLKYLTLNDSQLTSLDLKSSQVTILANLMMHPASLINSIKSSKYDNLKKYLNSFSQVTPKEYDINGFLDYCVEKDIYGLMASKAGVSRSAAKSSMMTILFSEPSYRVPKEFNISPTFPDFFDYLKKIKAQFKKDFGSSKRHLALFLQLVESHIFLENIYNHLAERKQPAFTKHDSILVQGEFEIVNTTKDLIQQAFDDLKFKGCIKEEKYYSVDTSNNFYNHPYYNMIIIAPEVYDYPEVDEEILDRI